MNTEKVIGGLLVAAGVATVGYLAYKRFGPHANAPAPGLQTAGTSSTGVQQYINQAGQLVDSAGRLISTFNNAFNPGTTSSPQPQVPPPPGPITLQTLRSMSWRDANGASGLENKIISYDPSTGTVRQQLSNYIGKLESPTYISWKKDGKAWVPWYGEYRGGMSGLGNLNPVSLII